MFSRLIFITILLLTVITVLPLAGAEILLSVSGSASLMAKKNQAASSWQKEIKFTTPGRHKVKYRLTFNVPDKLFSRQLIALQLVKDIRLHNLKLNGQPLPLPLPGMHYKVINNIPPKLLKRGENIITGSLSVKVKKTHHHSASKLYPTRIKADELPTALYGLTPNDLAFIDQPVLGWAGTNFFTVTCRTNVAVPVTLLLNGKPYSTDSAALLHKFQVTGLQSDTTYQYALSIKNRAKKLTTATFTVKTYPKAGPFSFAVLGDSRSQPEQWGKVAAAVLRHRPLFVMFDGDLVSNGTYNYQWHQQLFKPAGEFFATLPQYVAIGNHERDDQLFYHIFQGPKNQKRSRWSQRIGNTLIIIINGASDWQAGSDNIAWLENRLRNSDAAFIFLCSHYPAWSSGTHTRLNSQGRAREKSVYNARKYIMPLLKKYHATAMFAGHDHFYERSEPTDGVTMILTGGAGAPLRQKYRPHRAISDKELKAFRQRQNPYSKVWVSKYHFCLIKVEGKYCTMEAITPSGTVIDRITWQAREPAQSISKHKTER